MKKRLLLTAIATMMVASLLTGCGNTEQTDVEPTENTEVESIVESTESTETEIVEETVETVETETPASEEPESEVVETTPEETEPEKPAYTYTDMDKTMYAKSSVNVRNLPSTDGEKLGGLSKAQEVHVTGQCNETGWYRIDYNGSTRYVSSSYLVNEKPAEPQPEPEEPTQPSEPEECPYELGVWYDMGWYFFKLYPDGQSVESGSGQEYGQILNERYPDVVNSPAGTSVNMYGPSKWNGWYAYFWTAGAKGQYVFFQY